MLMIQIETLEKLPVSKTQISQCINKDILLRAFVDRLLDSSDLHDCACEQLKSRSRLAGFTGRSGHLLPMKRNFGFSQPRFVQAFYYELILIDFSSRCTRGFCIFAAS